MAGSVSLEDARKCFNLIEECTELWDDPGSWQNHLTAGIERLIGGCAGLLGASRFAPTGGAVVQESHISESNDAALRLSFARYIDDGGFELMPEFEAIAPVVLAQRRIAYSRLAVLSKKDYRRSAFYQRYLREHRIEDGLSAVEVAQDGLIVGMSLMRTPGERGFSVRDENMLALLAGLTADRVGKRLATREQLGRHLLSPRLRATLVLLLDGASEKEIAHSLAISRATAHEYVTALYRRFGVRSRAGIMAYFLRRRPVMLTSPNDDAQKRPPSSTP
jgi:DNA-binding CsgD family transcriptional regulator